jgi:hypothetical protein
MAENEPAASSATSLALLFSAVGVGGTLLGATLAPVINYLVNERQMDVKMVEIGIGILRAPPKEDIAVIRSWAIDVIERSSGRKFTEAQRAALVKQELPWSEPRRGYSDGSADEAGPNWSGRKPVFDRFPLTPKN